MFSDLSNGLTPIHYLSNGGCKWQDHARLDIKQVWNKIFAKVTHIDPEELKAKEASKVKQLFHATKK